MKKFFNVKHFVLYWMIIVALFLINPTIGKNSTSMRKITAVTA